MNSEELYQIVKKYLRNLSIVDDILEIPGIKSISLENYDSDLNENELYNSLRSVKKEAQLKLNLYKSADHFANCQILNEDIFSSLSSKISDYQGTMNENEKDSVLIETMCCYIKSYNIVLCAELKIEEKNEIFITKSQNIRKASLIYNNEFTKNNEYINRPCNKCTFINRKSLVNCEMCFGSLTNPVSYKKPNCELGEKALSVPIVNNQLEQSSYIKQIFPKGFFKIILRYKFYKIDKWRCNKCSMENITSICVACLNSSPDINKWQCENCMCVNNIIRENCKYCQSLNPNLIVCPECKKMKVISERMRCDNCWIKEFPRYKTNVKAVKKIFK